MNSRARFLVATGSWTLLVAVVMVAVPVLLRGRLPDPIAVEWTYSGTPEGSRFLGDYLFGNVLWWLVIAAVWALLGVRGVIRRRGRSWVAAALGAFGVVMLGTVVTTVLANLDAGSFQNAAERAGHGWLLLGAAFAAWAGWRLAGRDQGGPAGGVG
ncbi:hypothetical protein [Saccharopolyspora cebuensis]|uniref:DUF998 domain-containing protein n=1 Tax=Saccharopolyspora cebuensis TaxID=418759 RepID=A0ABV4CCY7_9PSEU